MRKNPGNSRVTLNYDCAINVISFFDSSDIVSLFNVALVDRQLGAAALRMLWSEPIPLVSLDFDERRTHSFVMTLVSCMEPDARARLQRAGLSLPPQCSKRPTFPYASFIRCYGGEIASRLADDWADAHTSFGGWTETASELIKELNALMLRTGALRSLYVDWSSVPLPATATTGSCSRRDWKVRQLAHLSTCTDKKFDDWNVLLAEACAGLQSLWITASEEESDCEKAVHLIAAQRKLGDLALIGTSSEWGKRDSPFRKVLACVLGGFRHVTIVTKTMGPHEIPRHANARTVRCFTREHTFGYYHGVHLHPFQCILATVGSSLTKLSVEHRDHNRPICEALETNCPSLRELRITLRHSQHMRSFENLLRSLHCLELLQLHRQTAITLSDLSWDFTLKSISNVAGASLHRLVFDGAFRFTIAGARDFMEWSSNRGVQVVFDEQIGVQSRKKRLFNAERHLEDYVRKKRNLVIRNAKDLTERWESDEVLKLVID